VRTNIMHNKPLDKLLKPPKIITYNKQQLQLNIGVI
jgi:hypothetical protein